MRGLRYHHVGIPTDVPGEGEWLRFTEDPPLPDLVKTVPDFAFETVDHLLEIQWNDVHIEPNSLSEGVTEAFTAHDGAPVEFLQYVKKEDRDEDGD